MATTTETVEIQANYPGREPMSRGVEVELVENPAGRVVVRHGAVAVELTDLCGLGEKIVERTMIARPGEGVLTGDVTPKGRRATVPASIKVDGRPDHQALYDACRAINARLEGVRQAMFAEHKRASDEADRARMPAGAVPVTFSHSEADGWIEVWTDGEGRALRSPRIAGQAGRLGWMTVEAHREAVEAHDKTKADETAAPQDETPARDVPAAAIEAYRRFAGDADAAWEAEDEAASILIGRWADEIESRGLATAAALSPTPNPA